MRSQFDFVIVGAGIIGAAVARELSVQYPNTTIAIIEKESGAAQHQTGRNSGVIHAGVYYPPGSLKAQYCREGLNATIDLCDSAHIPYQQCGKIVVATSQAEEARLESLFERCKLNDLNPRMLTGKQVTELEPNISGVAGMWVKQTGITDFTLVTRCLLQQAKASTAVKTFYSAKVDEIVENGESVNLSLIQENRRLNIKGDFLICCAGAYSDELISKQGLPCDFKIIPFKGEYFRLSERFDNVTRKLIYPVPDPAMPFLGVHLTKMIGGYTTVGPNAVLAPGREAYSAFKTDFAECWRLASFSGLYKLLWQFKRHLVSELQSSFSKTQYVKQIKRYCPEVNVKDLSYYRPGIRAQAVTNDGQLLHDFKFVRSERALHVGNAPSPAATSAIPIAKAIVNVIKR